MPDPNRLDAASHAQDQEIARNRFRARSQVQAATANSQLVAIVALVDIELGAITRTAENIARHRRQKRALNELASQMQRTIITLQGVKRLASLHEEGSGR